MKPTSFLLFFFFISFSLSALLNSQSFHSNLDCTCMLKHFDLFPAKILSSFQKIQSNFLSTKSKYSIKLNFAIEFSQIQIPVEVNIFFNRFGKLTWNYNFQKCLLSKFNDQKISFQFIKNTIEQITTRFLESLIKEGLKTKIAFTFPYLTFIIALEEIINIYHPFVSNYRENLYNIEYSYLLPSLKKIGRIGVNINFNYRQIKNVIAFYEKNLEKFENLWNKNNVIHVGEEIKARLFHLKYYLSDIEKGKKTGKITEVSGIKMAKSIRIDEKNFNSFLVNLKKLVVSKKLNKIVNNLSNTGCRTSDWYTALEKNLNENEKVFAKNEFKLIFNNEKLQILGSKGYVSIVEKTRKRRKHKKCHLNKRK